MEKSTSFHTICRLLLRELRQERNVQQAHIGQLLGKSTSSWSKVETGDTPLSLDHLLTACSACQVWPSNLLEAAQDYMTLLVQNGWYVAGHGAALPKEEDLLSVEADAYYATAASNVQTPVWGRYPVLQTPWPYPGSCVPLDVFRWVLDPQWKASMLSSEKLRSV
ncbi:helix-turn-helix domain-containing protein [Burkholderia glumae]|uniref:helix-turn-helix domain-containing protein n=1 Tax=Burkholderia glumae TaxID=337 RepID=UPI0020CF87F6|nr:helix-turn-helix transcriptional regulator [Burkholderia glumae]